MYFNESDPQDIVAKAKELKAKIIAQMEGKVIDTAAGGPCHVSSPDGSYGCIKMKGHPGECHNASAKVSWCGNCMKWTCECETQEVIISHKRSLRRWLVALRNLFYAPSPK